MENCLTNGVMVVLVHKCVQQTHLLTLHLETLGYIPSLLQALNGLVYLLTGLVIQTEDAECNLILLI